jgi:hypothetical protein
MSKQVIIDLLFQLKDHMTEDQIEASTKALAELYEQCTHFPFSERRCKKVLANPANDGICDSCVYEIEKYKRDKEFHLRKIARRMLIAEREKNKEKYIAFSHRTP